MRAGRPWNATRSPAMRIHRHKGSSWLNISSAARSVARMSSDRRQRRPAEGPLPSQNSGRMNSGTNPGMSNAEATPAFCAWRGCCCRSRTSRRPAAAAPASRERARPWRPPIARCSAPGRSAAATPPRRATGRWARSRSAHRARRSGRSARRVSRRGAPAPAARRPRWLRARSTGPRGRGAKPEPWRAPRPGCRSVRPRSASAGAARSGADRLRR